MCLERHIPFSPVRTVEEVAQDKQLEARRFWVELEHPEAGKLKYPGSGYELSKTPAKIEHVAPRLGEHNQEILGGRLEYSEKELARLMEEQ
jgi:formyl-CoA transferase